MRASVFVSRVMCGLGWHDWRTRVAYDRDVIETFCCACGSVSGELARQESVSERLEDLGERELARMVRQRERPRRVVPGFDELGLFASEQSGPVRPPPPPPPEASNSARPPC